MEFVADPTPRKCFIESPQYQSHYCEENVYKLAEAFVEDVRAGRSPDKGYAVFISNSEKACPIWRQKLSDGDDPVVWDCHVVFMTKGEGTSVIDLDTKLGFPCKFDHYAQSSFQPARAMQSKYRQMFRVIPADIFISNFASDRSHMIDQEATAAKRSASESTSTDVVYLQPPPPWPLIRGAQAGCTNNLNEFISMSKLSDMDRFGIVLTLQEFIAFGQS